MIPLHPPDRPTWPEENRAAAVRLGQVMKQLHKHISSQVMRGLQTELTEMDLSFSQMTALHHLRAHGASSVTSISEHARLSLPASSQLVERLVQRGLAQREENPENRREKLVSLTDLGRDMLGQMDSGFVEAYVTTFSRLSPATLQAATQTLQTLLDELDPADRDHCPFDPSSQETL